MIHCLFNDAFFKLHRCIQREIRNGVVVVVWGEGGLGRKRSLFYLKYAYCLRICFEEIRSRNKGHWITGPDTNGAFLRIHFAHMKSLSLSISTAHELGHVT